MRGSVQYVAAADGTILACTEEGQGLPCLYLSPIASHLERARDVDALRSFFDWTAARARLVRMDYRGTGLSQRGAVDCSMDRIVEDIDRVLGHFGVEGAAVLSFGPSTLAAIAFAHRFPSRVGRLVLHHPVVTGSDLQAGGGMAQLGEIAQTNWELFTVLGQTAVFGGSDARADQQAAVLRAAASPAEYFAHWNAHVATDVSALLPEIAVPALVILPAQSIASQPNSVRRVAARLPNARVVEMEGKYVARVLDDPRMVAAIADFLGLPVGSAAPAAQSTAVILFADIVDSTALTEQLGDDAFRRRARDLDERLRGLIRDGTGRSIDGKLVGDGVLAVFASARNAIAVALRCRDAASAAGLSLHLGLHAGDVIDEGGNVYGGAVNLAARVAAAAAPGEVLVTDTVRGLARTSAEVDFTPRGAHELKGVGEPQALFAVSPR
ncbi:MAG TPA: adenylate/guanylate cyclase domain-containing protein [Candidatus Eisenbacteria bacterium]|nr:adenylate/guanylate cyclase domain-containing protein [Candidatus Eisenbacteria bacterium]